MPMKAALLVRRKRRRGRNLHSKCHAKRSWKGVLSDDDSDFEWDVPPRSKRAWTRRPKSTRSRATPSLTSHATTSPSMSTLGPISPSFKTDCDNLVAFTLEQVRPPLSDPAAHCLNHIAPISETPLTPPMEALWEMDKAEWDRQWADFQACVFRARELQRMQSGDTRVLPYPSWTL
ncbi:hypothetical protein BC830DRAFT_1121281 [Chytriomyces sp. MP71]|nr:hypothetical protein BC830DRAFT_1121281 [Chytriomyces sp. MP71]